jgi:hypothetical protein
MSLAEGKGMEEAKVKLQTVSIIPFLKFFFNEIIPHDTDGI